MSTAVLIAVVIVVAAIVLYVITIYNGLVTVKNNVDKAWSNIDVVLKQRFDEIPKLVKVCERYMKHEAETLEKVIRARAGLSGAAVRDVGRAENMITEALKSLFAVSEQYPELRADRRFGQLQSRISELEDEISDRRELYNESVNIHNIRIAKFPDVMVANMFAYRPRELWQINPSERADPGVNFSS
jgi:LemA protein